MTPGMFVRVRLPIGQPQKQLLVIDRAISSDLGVKKVFVVGEGNKVKAVPVSVGALQADGLRVVSGEGLTKDSLVLVGGWQQVRPNMVIQPEMWPMLRDPATPEADGKGKK